MDEWHDECNIDSGSFVHQRQIRLDHDSGKVRLTLVMKLEGGLWNSSARNRRIDKPKQAQTTIAVANLSLVQRCAKVCEPCMIQ